MKDMQLIQAVVSSTGIRFSILECGNEVGRLFVYFLQNDLHERPFALAEDLYVLETARGKGYGGRLLKEAIAAAHRHGCYKLIGTIRHTRKDLHSYYHEQGWRNHGICVRIDFD